MLILLFLLLKLRFLNGISTFEEIEEEEEEEEAADEGDEEVVDIDAQVSAEEEGVMGEGVMDTVEEEDGGALLIASTLSEI